MYCPSEEEEGRSIRSAVQRKQLFEMRSAEVSMAQVEEEQVTAAVVEVELVAETAAAAAGRSLLEID